MRSQGLRQYFGDKLISVFPLSQDFRHKLALQGHVFVKVGPNKRLYFACIQDSSVAIPFTRKNTQGYIIPFPHGFR